MAAWSRSMGWLGATADAVWPGDLVLAVEAAEGAAGDGGGAWGAESRERYCGRCGASAGPGAATAGGCSQCRDRRVAWDAVTRLGPYEPPLDGWIRSMKFEGQWAWARRFGEALGGAMSGGMIDDRVAVCAAPMFWLRRWRRGYNQANLIARELARCRGWAWAPILKRTRHTPPQTSVPPSSRRGNVAGSFALASVDLTGWRVVLVDDVLTSGATLEGCARLLRRAGAARIDAAVIAVGHPQQA